MKLADCTRLQKRYLSRHVCWLCEAPLDTDHCYAVMAPRCELEVIEKRRTDCLAHYRSRRRQSHRP